MPKYIRKPVIIESVQWTGKNFDEVMNFMQEFLGHKVAYEDAEENAYKTGQLVIRNLDGNSIAEKNDFIIKGVQGDFYPCRPEAFEKMYNLYSIK